jgi:hypothetical protein
MPVVNPGAGLGAARYLSSSPGMRAKEVQRGDFEAKCTAINGVHLTQTGFGEHATSGLEKHCNNR